MQSLDQSLSSYRLKEDLEGLAHALEISSEGNCAELTTCIKEKLRTSPELSTNPHFYRLFPPSHKQPLCIQPPQYIQPPLNIPAPLHIGPPHASNYPSTSNYPGTSNYAHSSLFTQPLINHQSNPDSRILTNGGDQALC